MTKRLLFILLLCATPAAAQIGVPSTAPGSGSGTTTITDGVTATSGFSAGEVIYSDGSVVQGLQIQALLNGAVCTSAVGTDAYACSPAAPSVCPASLADSPPVILTTDVANTGASTFAYCGLAAKAIVRGAPTASTATVTGDMVAAYGYLLQYNATGDNWKLLSIPASVFLINQANTVAASTSFTASVTVSNNLSALLGLRTLITVNTTTATTSFSTSGNVYTNTGDADGSTTTLMNDPTDGTFWHFAVTAAQTMTIVASAGETLNHEGTACGTSLTSNTVGSTLLIRTVVAGSGGTFMTFGASGVWVCTP